MKDKKYITIENVFQKVLVESGLKSSKVWVNQGSEFYNRLLKSLLHDNGIEMYSTHNKGKSVAERFIRTLKNKIYKKINAVSKNVYSNKLDKIVDKDSKTYLRTIKIKPAGFQLGTYVEYDLEYYDRDPKLNVGDHVRISNYKKKSFLKGCTLNWSEQVFVIKRVKKYCTMGIYYY